MKNDKTQDAKARSAASADGLSTRERTDVQARLRRERRRSELHWYVLLVAGQHERQLLEALSGTPDPFWHGKRDRNLPKLDPPVEAYVPIRAERRQWSDRLCVRPVVLLPGVVFVRIALADYQRVFVCNYVRSFLYDRDKREPAAIDDERMEQFRHIVESADEVAVQTPVPGSTVQIISGPYKGYVGEVIQEYGKSRFQLRLTEGFAVTLTIDEALLKVVPAGTPSVIPEDM